MALAFKTMCPLTKMPSMQHYQLWRRLETRSNRVARDYGPPYLKRREGVSCVHASKFCLIEGSWANGIYQRPITDGCLAYLLALAATWDCTWHSRVLSELFLTHEHIKIFSLQPNPFHIFRASPSWP